MSMHFGEHVTVDGYGGDSEILNSGDAVRSALSELCDILEMHPLTEPQVVLAGDNQIKDPGGWSGFLIIAESHIAMHTFPKRRFISADVYTCRNGVDEATIVNYFKEKFKLAEVETHFIKRGEKYPEHNLA